MADTQLRYNNRSYFRASQAVSFRPYLITMIGIIAFTLFGYSLQNLMLALYGIDTGQSTQQITSEKNNNCKEFVDVYSGLVSSSCSRSPNSIQLLSYLNEKGYLLEHDLQRPTN